MRVSIVVALIISLTSSSPNLYVGNIKIAFRSMDILPGITLCDSSIFNYDILLSGFTLSPIGSSFYKSKTLGEAVRSLGSEMFSKRDSNKRCYCSCESAFTWGG